MSRHTDFTLRGLIQAIEQKEHIGVQLERTVVALFDNDLGQTAAAILCNQESVARVGSSKVHVLVHFINCLASIDGRHRQDVRTIMCNLARRVMQNKFIILEFAMNNCIILRSLTDALACEDTALTAGEILCNFMQHELIAKLFLFDDELAWRLLGLCNDKAVLVGGEARDVLRHGIAQHKTMFGAFLKRKYTEVVAIVRDWLTTEYGFNLRQLVALFKDMLLDRSNFDFMQAFVGCPVNLGVIMPILSGNYPDDLRYDTFRVWGMFVGNPRPSPEVVGCLVANMCTIVDLVQDFLSTNDAKFPRLLDEKKIVLHALGQLRMRAEEERKAR